MKKIDKAILEAYGEEELNDALENDYNMDYILYDATDEESLGYELIATFGFECLSKEVLERYFNYEEFGRDYALNADGNFTTEGFIERLL